jgi:single-strand DNA-binding protein
VRLFHKGQLVAVQGAIQTRSYKNKDGIKRKEFEIVADNVHFADSKPAGNGGNPPADLPQNTAGDDFEEVLPGDDLPF